MTSREPSHLDGAALERLFPFHFVFDATGRVRDLGPGLSKLLGPDEVVGRRLTDFAAIERPKSLRLTPASLEEHLGALVVLRLSGRGVRLRGQVERLADGGTRWAFLGSPWILSLEDLGRAGLSLSDFSAVDPLSDFLILLRAATTAVSDAEGLAESLRAQSARLRDALQRAEAASVAKGTFLAMMSHELRTPMNGLGSMLDLLTRTRLDAEQLGYVAILHSCSESLVRIVDDVLDLTKLEADQVRVERAAFQPHLLLRELCLLFLSSASERGLTLTWEVDERTPVSVLGDAARCRQVLGHLIGNAIKFTGAGGIEVRLAPGPDADQISFRVRDHGPGVPPEHSERIFDAFVQGDESTTRPFGGAGLGLHIGRRLARLMGGDLQLVDSGPQGSTFAFHVEAPAVLPEPAPALPARVVSASLRFEPCRVLVAEDNPVNRSIAERLLERLGIEAVLVEDGQRACEVFAQDAFDLVLMDLNMPRLDGRAATRRMRELEAELGRSRTPVIAFTADVLASRDGERPGDDFEGRIAKPVRLESLAAQLARWLPIAAVE